MSLRQLFYRSLLNIEIISVLLEFVNTFAFFFSEPLITVTADHSHVFTIGGYPKRGNPVFGLIKEVDDQFTLSADGNPYTTLGYADGPGGLNGSRPNITNEDTADKDYLQQATVLLDYESHASEDVGKTVAEF